MPSPEAVKWAEEHMGLHGEAAVHFANWLEKNPQTANDIKPSDEELSTHGINVKRPDISLDWVEKTMGLQGPDAQRVTAMLQSGVQIPGLQLPPAPGTQANNNVPLGGDEKPGFQVSGDDKQKHLETIRDLHNQRRQQIEAQLYDIFGLMHPDSGPAIGQGLAGPAVQGYNGTNPLVQSASAAYPDPMTQAATQSYPSTNPSPQTPLITNSPLKSR